MKTILEAAAAGPQEFDAIKADRELSNLRLYQQGEVINEAIGVIEAARAKTKSMAFSARCFASVAKLKRLQNELWEDRDALFKA